MRLLLLTLLAAGLGGCATSSWKSIAMDCVDSMEEVGPAIVSCAAHMKADHPGHKLNPDGSLRIQAR